MTLQELQARRSAAMDSGDEVSYWAWDMLVAAHLNLSEPTVRQTLEYMSNAINRKYAK